MRNLLNRRLQMYGAVEAALDGNPTGATSIPALQPRIAAFRGKLADIRSKLDVGASSTSGVTEEKAQSRERASNECFALANALVALAEDKKDEVLKAQFPTAITSFQIGKAVDLAGLYMAVLKTARENAHDLEPFGFHATALDAVEAAVNDFQQKMNGPKLARQAKSNLLNQFIEEFGAMDGILESLDYAINAVRNAQTVFFTAYTKARYLGFRSTKKTKETPPPAELRKPAQPQPANRPSASEGGLVMGGSGFDKPLPSM